MWVISNIKSTCSLKKLKILRSKVTEIFMNLRKKFCEYPPSSLGFSDILVFDRSRSETRINVNYERKILRKESLGVITLPRTGYDSE